MENRLFFKSTLLFLVIGIIAFLIFIILIIKTENLIFLAIFLSILIIFGIISGLILTVKPYVFVKEHERLVLFRLGRIVGCFGPGVVFIIPKIDEYVIVDIRVRSIDLSRQVVITKDNLALTVDAVIYYKIVDPIKAVVNVRNLEKNLELLVVSELRAIIGKLNSMEVVANIDEINNNLQLMLKKYEDSWGIDVVSVQLRSVDFPPDVLNAMHRRKAAEERKLAREQEIEALKMEMEAVKEVSKEMDEKALLYYYIKALEKLGVSQSTKFVIPLEFSSFAAFFAKSFGRPQEEVEKELSVIWPKLKKKLEEFKKE
jgi:regulator of protease activity HflC (stomatin/prohibitin superfamily)